MRNNITTKEITNIVIKTKEWIDDLLQNRTVEERAKFWLYRLSKAVDETVTKLNDHTKNER